MPIERTLPAVTTDQEGSALNPHSPVVYHLRLFAIVMQPDHLSKSTPNALFVGVQSTPPFSLLQDRSNKYLYNIYIYIYCERCTFTTIESAHSIRYDIVMIACLYGLCSDCWSGWRRYKMHCEGGVQRKKMG